MKTVLKKNSFWFNRHVENNHRKGRSPIAGGNAPRQQKIGKNSLPPGAKSRARRGDLAVRGQQELEQP